MVILFGSVVSKKVQLLLLQHTGSIRSSWTGAVLGEMGLRVPVSRRCGRAGRPCGGRVRRVGARAGVTGVAVECL
eukprot:3813252-Prymnesium_polylepis.1